jgi:hypothetical protein
VAKARQGVPSLRGCRHLSATSSEIPRGRGGAACGHEDHPRFPQSDACVW